MKRKGFLETKQNHLIVIMDACRWDMFERANAPTMKSLGKPKMLISNGGYTVPSMFSLITNAPQYGNHHARFIPDEQHFQWVPDVATRAGYYSAFITPNQLMTRYSHVFKPGWGFTKFYWSAFRYSIDKDIQRIIDIWNMTERPKLVVLLTMETHGPFPYSPDLTEEYFKNQKNVYDVTNQILAVEAIDKELNGLFSKIGDNNTIVSIFSDHGTLDPTLEGAKGHAFGLYHPKLFEVPFVRGKI